MWHFIADTKRKQTDIKWTILSKCCRDKSQKVVSKVKEVHTIIMKHYKHQYNNYFLLLLFFKKPIYGLNEFEWKGSLKLKYKEKYCAAATIMNSHLQFYVKLMNVFWRLRPFKFSIIYDLIWNIFASYLLSGTLNRWNIYQFSHSNCRNITWLIMFNNTNSSMLFIHYISQHGVKRTCGFLSLILYSDGDD